MRSAVVLPVLAVLIGGAAIPGSVAAPGSVAGDSVSVPRHTRSDSSLQLIGAGPDTFVVTQGPAPGDVLSGAAGTVLADQGFRVDPAGISALDGNRLTWSRPRAAGGSVEPGWEVVTRVLSTGAVVVSASADRPVALTPDGWLGLAGGTLTRHTFAGVDTPLLAEITTPAEYFEVKADAAGALVQYDVRIGDQDQGRIGLITFGRPGIEILFRQEDTGGVYQRYPRTIALSPNRVVWATSSGLGFGNVQLRPRAGGPVRTFRFSGYYGVAELAANDEQVAAISHDRAGQGWPWTVSLSVLSGRTWRDVRLPDGVPSRANPMGYDNPHPALSADLFGGITAVGSDFVFALGGDTGTSAGVYRVGPAGVAKQVGFVGPERAAVREVELSARRLSYDLVTPEPGPAGDPVDSQVWQRPLMGVLGAAPGVPRLGAERVLAVKVSVPPAIDRPAISFSAGRGLLHGSSDDVLYDLPQYRLLDRGMLTRVLPVSAPVRRFRISGPYALIGSRVFRVDGHRMPALTSERILDADLFGGRAVYRTPGGVVRTRSVTGNGPVLTLARSGAGGAVTIWGDRVAWLRSDRTVAVRTLGSAAVRVVDPGGPVTGLRLSEGVLSWQGDDGEFRVLDLRSPTSGPIAVSGLSRVVVDGPLLAGVTAVGAAQVRTLPFAARPGFPPRLIGILASARFLRRSQGTVWSPQVDATAPIRSVRLSLSRGGRVVRVITGSGPDGSVRDLVWDGKDTDGRRVAAGRYRWTVTALAVDGSGPLIGAQGRGPIVGTVTVGP